MSSSHLASGSRDGESYQDHEVQTSSRGREIPYSRPQPPIRRETDSYDWKEPSYYGPDFQNVEKGLSSSFSLPRSIPKEPVPYVKRPDPYPPHVLSEYDYYKQKGVEADKSKREYNSLKQNGAKPKAPRNQIEASNHQAIIDQGNKVRREANDAAMSRSGFIQKYPSAYAQFDDQNHWAMAMSRKAQATNIAFELERVKKDLDIYDEKRRGITPTSGLPKAEYRRRKEERKH